MKYCPGNISRQESISNSLKEELEKAKEEIYTPDCRYHACQKCGLCDFKTLLPIVYNRSGKAVDTDLSSSPLTNDREKAEAENSAETGHFKYLVHYSRIGDICFLGHLEILQVIFRTLRRASIDN